MKVLGGPKRRIFIKIDGIKVSRVFFDYLYVIIFQHTARIFPRYYALYIHMYEYIYYINDRVTQRPFTLTCYVDNQFG